MNYLTLFGISSLFFTALIGSPESSNDLKQFDLEPGSDLISESLSIPSYFNSRPPVQLISCKKLPESSLPLHIKYKQFKVLERQLFFIEEQGGSGNSAEQYFQLASYYLEAAQYDAAINCLLQAEKKGFKHLDKVYFQLARAYAFKDVQLGTMEDYLHKASMHGFRNYRALLYDSAFATLRKSDEILYIYANLFENNQQAMFKLFCKIAPKSNAKENLLVDTAVLFKTSNRSCGNQDSKPTKTSIIPFQFSAFIEGIDEEIYSRGAADDFRFEQVIRDSNYIAILYSRTDTRATAIMPKQYHLISFDRHGNKISELLLGKKGSLTNAKGFFIGQDRRIDVYDYHLCWKSNTANMARQSGQYLTTQDLKKVIIYQITSYQINAMGRINIQEMPLYSMQ